MSKNPTGFADQIRLYAKELGELADKVEINEIGYYSSKWGEERKRITERRREIEEGLKGIAKAILNHTRGYGYYLRVYKKDFTPEEKNSPEISENPEESVRASI